MLGTIVIVPLNAWPSLLVVLLVVLFIALFLLRRRPAERETAESSLWLKERRQKAVCPYFRAILFMAIFFRLHFTLTLFLFYTDIFGVSRYFTSFFGAIYFFVTLSYMSLILFLLGRVTSRMFVCSV